MLRVVASVCTGLRLSQLRLLQEPWLLVTYNAVQNYLQYNTITYATNGTKAYTTYSKVR